MSDDRMWTAADVVAFLRMSLSWVQKAAARGDLPCHRIGRALRFNPEEIREFARSGYRRRRVAKVRVLPRAGEPSP